MERSRRVLAPALVVMLLVLLYFPSFVWLVRSWMTNPYYSHGFLVPLVSVYIARRKRGKLKGGAPYRPGLLLLLLGLMVYLLGFLGKQPSIIAFSFLIVLAALLLYLGGKAALRTLAFPLGFLVLMVPLPFLNDLTPYFQTIATRASASTVEALGIGVAAQGGEIRIQDATFVIGAVCAGMNTLIALLTLGTIFVYLVKGPFHMKVLLLAISLPIAIWANILRIVSVLLVAYYWGAAAAMRFYHDFSSILLYLAAFLVLVLLARFLGCSLPLSQREKGQP